MEGLLKIALGFLLTKLKKIVHALESRAAKSRYKITIPTYIAEILIRFCSTKFRDKIIKKHISKRFS